jgi:hypothetical protein
MEKWGGRLPRVHVVCVVLSLSLSSTLIRKDSTMNTIHKQTKKEQKYDRQLRFISFGSLFPLNYPFSFQIPIRFYNPPLYRLWGEDGQARLEHARICALGSGPVATEILKNLILPGRFSKQLFMKNNAIFRIFCRSSFKG